MDGWLVAGVRSGYGSVLFVTAAYETRFDTNEIGVLNVFSSSVTAKRYIEFT